MNWWGYGTEITVHATQIELEETMSEIILQEDVKLRVIVEGREPTCYSCREKGHIKTKCPQNEKKTGQPKNTPINDKQESSTQDSTTEVEMTVQPKRKNT